MEAVIQVETGDDSTLINITEKAVGLIQIKPIMLYEANRIAGYKKYTLKDRYSAKKSIEIWYLVQKYYNPHYNFEIACKVWNAGDMYSTCNDVQKYIIKVKTEYELIQISKNKLCTSSSTTYRGSGRMVVFAKGKRREFSL